MKHSIYKIFKNLNLLLLISLTISFIAFLFIVEQYYSHQKIKNLQNKKVILNAIIKEEKESNEIDILNFNANIAKINLDITELQNQDQYNYISKYITKNEEANQEGLKTLETLVQNFHASSKKYFKHYHTKKELSTILNSLVLQHTQMIAHIDTLMIENIYYDNDRFRIFASLFILLLLMLLVSTIWQKKRLNSIYEDILFLYSIDSEKKNKIIFSQEIDAISMRMKRKNQVSDNPTMMDQITEIYNNKGMIQTYSQRKSIQDNNFTCVAILEIDNFSKAKRTFSQNFTQEILKKVSYTISLHEQSNDIIARTDYNQFTLIFSRPGKDQLFKDVDLVRQSIADIQISSPDKKAIQITVTGGLIMKSKNSPLEEYIRKAKDLLQSAKHIGSNKILQTKDIPK